MDAQKQQQKASNLPDIEALGRQTVAQLKAKYRELFGQESRSNHKQFLMRRVAWRLQAIAEGDLSERARLRALTRNSLITRDVAPRHGFEPRFTAPKAAVLPLDDRGKSALRKNTFPV